MFTEELPDQTDPLRVPTGVYPPQEDSALLIGALRASGLAAGRRVADLCSGSGVVALAAAQQGAATVAAFEMSSRAVDCARANAAAAGLPVKVHRGSWTRAVEFERFDVVTCNPPYVPFDDGADDTPVAESAGPAAAWNAGRDGRRILDPLCESAAELLTDGGSIFIVHSEFANVDRTVADLSAAGLRARVVAEQWIPFGPVLTARALWLERIGMLETGRRRERLAVVRADRV
ncbi:methyltransferase [Mycobacterium yunnanensis]|uniref:Methyltransferase n=1 Tax=Mycobacterium yunnanensis TaxID=368477 RepID=A0A9X2YZC1_9MYCO|nr:methyltransferase [Mycobacterium yunnanensis]